MFDDVNPIRTGAYDVSATYKMNAMNAPANPISISNNTEIARVRGVHRQQYTPRTKHVRTPPLCSWGWCLPSTAISSVSILRPHSEPSGFCTFNLCTRAINLSIARHCSNTEKKGTEKAEWFRSRVRACIQAPSLTKTPQFVFGASYQRMSGKTRRKISIAGYVLTKM